MPGTHRKLRFREVPILHPPPLTAGLLSLSAQKRPPSLRYVKTRVRDFVVPLYFAYFYASAAAEMLRQPCAVTGARRNLSAIAPRPRGSGTMFAISFPAPFSAPRFLCSGFVSLLFLSSPKFMELSTLYTTPRGVVNLHFPKMPAPAGCSAGCSYSSRK